MAEYQEITDTEVQPEAPLTSSLGVRFRDNPLAVWEGAPSAPRINGQQGPAVNTGGIFNSAVTQAKLAANAAGRSELKMGTNSVSGTIAENTNLTINLTDYSLFPSTYSDRIVTMRLDQDGGSANAANPKFQVRNEDNTSGSYAVAWRFIKA